MIVSMRKVWKRGDFFIWLAGVGLALSLIMVAGLLLTIFVNAATFFWPADLLKISLKSGDTVLGIQTGREAIPDPENPEAEQKYRLQIKRGNRDITGADFIWIDEEDIARIEKAEDALIVERREWGDFFGTLSEVREEGRGAAGLRVLLEKLEPAHEIHSAIERLTRKDIGAINYKMEKNRLAVRSTKDEKALARLSGERDDLDRRYKELETRLQALRNKQVGEAVFLTSDGKEVTIPLSKIIHVYEPNALGMAGRVGFFIRKVVEFVAEDPRESNTEGGVFPAIFGTVMMVMIMSLLVTPLGVLAAFYLREYARQGTMVSIVRIAVNNLAGVPSIVFGVFGVGFFIYFIGGSIDELFYSEKLPAPTFGTGGILWASLTMALLTVPVVIVSTEEGLASVSGGLREASLALGATKFETTWRVVLPAVMPSILTGLILAMARAAGEVAPLMITGVVKLAPALPVDGLFPFVHLERKFMHLGFHIYDVGFQSPNVDAARPMVFTTTLLLIVLVIVLNLTAIWLRNRLKKNLSASGV
ncbi:MAG: phosphate ABC transporter permease PstA [Nitrospinaceae bacterium]|nr:MAG: phosphate ABC transporter permease PstA [Nitrospinaceae bacterium]